MTQPFTFLASLVILVALIFLGIRVNGYLSDAHEERLAQAPGAINGYPIATGAAEVPGYGNCTFAVYRGSIALVGCAP